jgi:hypothetical protein
LLCSGLSVIVIGSKSIFNIHVAKIIIDTYLYFIFYTRFVVLYHYNTSIYVIQMNDIIYHTNN